MKWHRHIWKWVDNVRIHGQYGGTTGIYQCTKCDKRKFVDFSDPGLESLDKRIKRVLGFLP